MSFVNKPVQKKDAMQLVTGQPVFTGDLGNNDIPLLGEPTMIDDADFLVMESTYGSRLHNRNEQKAELVKQQEAQNFAKA